MLIAQPSRDKHPGPTSVLLPLSATNFYDEHDQETEVTFNIDSAGKVNWCKDYPSGYNKIC
ncbi:MAG: hypothetical protein WKG06_09710 [Segetibacter sp.]